MSSFSKGILSNYQIIRVLGKGTFSVVKLATDIRTNEKLAIKILEKNKIKSSRDYNRINREINILKKINHLNVVQVFEIKEDLDKYYIIMEYCEKGELFDLILSKRKLSEDESAYYFYQLVNGLEYIHLNNIMHRDLKPENLLLTKNDILKIIDFGLSNFNPGDNLLSTPCGSPCYASPEMVSGKKYNGFTNDVWSIGIILYAMIYGYLPFENLDNNNNALFKKIKECKVDYPKNNCLLALDLIKQILVPDFKQRIIISEIKKHKFYLKGRNIFKRKHRDLCLETGTIFNLLNNDKRINKAIKKYSNSEISSRINDFYEKDYNFNYSTNINNNKNDEILKNNQRVLNKRSINNKSPDIIIRNENKYPTRSQNKDRKVTSIEKNYFSILTTSNGNDRGTFSYNTNKTEIKLIKNNINQYSQRSSNYRLIPPKKTETNKFRIKVNPINEAIYPSSNIIEFSEKFPDFNSFSIENENEYFNEPHSNIKKNKLKEKKENYRQSEIKKINNDKNQITNDKNKFKEIKPISVINLRPKSELINNLTSPNKNELNFNLVKSYGTNRSHVKVKYNNENMKNKEDISFNNNFYFNNNHHFLNISNEKIENNKYNNTYAHISHVRHENSRSMCDKYFNINHNNLRHKNSEVIKKKLNNDAYKRMETSIGKNNYSHNYIEIIPGSNNKSKKLSSSNFKSNNNISNSNNFSSINNDTKNTRIKNYRRIITSNLRPKEETKEKQKEEKNKNIYYSNKNINVNNKYNNGQNEIKKIEKNKNHHETYIYVHRNSKEKNRTNDYIKNYNNKYRINNKGKEEISKVNISYENQNKYEKYSRKSNKLNMNKFSMSNLPSITIDMNVLNKNNNKYLKLYDAIKNKL